MKMFAKLTFSETYMNDQKIFFKSLGERLAHCRKEQGLTQVQLSEIADCSQQLIAEYEAGRLNIPVWRLLNIAEVLNVSVDELLKGSKKITRKRGPESKIDQLANQVKSMPRSRQLFVIEMLENTVSRTN